MNLASFIFFFSLPTCAGVCRCVKQCILQAFYDFICDAIFYFFGACIEKKNVTCIIIYAIALARITHYSISEIRLLINLHRTYLYQIYFHDCNHCKNFSNWPHTHKMWNICESVYVHLVEIHGEWTYSKNG